MVWFSHRASLRFEPKNLAPAGFLRFRAPRVSRPCSDTAARADPLAREFLAGRPVVAVHEAGSEEGAHPLLPSHRVENKRCPGAVMAGEQSSGERPEARRRS